MFPDRRRRGRKRKAEKMAELAMAEALARRHQAKTMSAFDPGEVYFVTRFYIDRRNYFIDHNKHTEICVYDV